MKNAATIVIPLLRQRVDWLRQCVTSALDQTVRCEVLVVVSPLTPNANIRILHELEQGRDNLVIVGEGPGRGFAAAINTGIREALTERVGLLLSDDWLEPAAVEACLKFPTDIVSTGAIVYSADCTRKIYDPRLTMTEYIQKPSLEARASYLEHFFLFNRSKLLEVGGVDESIGLTGPDDYDLVWTLLEHGATVSIVGKSLYNYRDHDGERLSLRSREDQVRDLEKILDKHGVPDCAKYRLIEAHSKWYGEPIYRVLTRLQEIT